MMSIDVTWSPRWSYPHQSLWDVHRKLACANVTSHHDAHRLLSGFHPDCLSTATQFEGASPAQLKWLQELLNVDQDVAQTMVLEGHREAMDDRSLCHGLRYCPSCAKHGWHFAIFQSYLLSLCPIHTEPLRTSCPHCGALKHVSAKTQDSFSECARCNRPYFDENWNDLRGFLTPRDTDCIQRAARAFAKRTGDVHVESIWSAWVVERSMCLPEHIPAYERIGSLLLGESSDIIFSGSTVVEEWEDCLYAPATSLTSVARAVIESMDEVAHLIGVGLVSGCSEPGKTCESKALFLTARLLNFHAGGAMQGIRRQLRMGLVASGLTVHSRRHLGVPVCIAAGEAQAVYARAAVRAWFVDALTWVREPTDGASWSDWPRLGRTPANPPVYVGTSISRSLIDIQMMGISDAALRLCVESLV